MALTYETFLIDFPQFAGMKNGEDRVSRALVRAYERCGEALGVHQDTAAGFLAAHLLATNPANENMALVKGLPATTMYWVEYERILSAARPVGLVSGPSTILRTCE